MGIKYENVGAAPESAARRHSGRNCGETLMISFWKRNRSGANYATGTECTLEPGRRSATCPGCKVVYAAAEAAAQGYICPGCGSYMPVGARERLRAARKMLGRMLKYEGE